MDAFVLVFILLASAAMVALCMKGMSKWAEASSRPPPPAPKMLPVREAVRRELKRGIDEGSEERVKKVVESIGLTLAELGADDKWNAYMQALCLYDLDTTGTSERVQAVVPFAFQKGERLVWAFGGVNLMEHRTVRRMSGGSLGMSFRVAKGVHLRPSAFRGSFEDEGVPKFTGFGTLGVTLRHVYFHSPNKSLRIPFSKIVAFTPLVRGVSVHRDGAASPQTFIVGEENADFIHTLLTKIAEKGA